jgi:hypothetical protein
MGINRGIYFPTALCAILSSVAPAASAPYVPGWPAEVGAVHFSSPAVADIDGDGKREVAVASWDDHLYLLTSDGRVSGGFPVNTPETAGEGEESSPVLADIDDDGVLDVVFLSNEGKLIALSADGNPLPGWPKTLGGTPDKASPVVQNLTNYGGLEVVAAVETTSGVTVYAFHGDGTPIKGWPIDLEGARSPSISVGDFDGDNTADVIVSAGDKVYAFYYNGKQVEGWPVGVGSAKAGALTIADVDGNGGETVFFGTSDGSAYAVDGRGRVRVGWPVKLCNGTMTAAPVPADIDGDGSLEIVFVAGGAHLLSSTVFAVDARGYEIDGFPRVINETVAAAPIAADVDGDGLPEIIVATGKGKIWAFGDGGETAYGFPLGVSGGKITATPTATDLDGDGGIDLVVATDGGTVEAISIGTPYNADACPWPTYGGNHWRSGKYHARKANVLGFDVRAKSDFLLISWESSPSSKRTAWRVLRAPKDDGLPGKYAELAEMPQEISGRYFYEDKDTESEETYYYVIEEVLTDGSLVSYGPKIITAPRTSASLISETKILNAYPNPFRSSISIPIQIGEDAGDVSYTVKVFDLSGKVIRTLASGHTQPGEYQIEWNAQDDGGNTVADGVYVVRLSTDDKRIVFSKSIILTRNE